MVDWRNFLWNLIQPIIILVDQPMKSNFFITCRPVVISIIKYIKYGKLTDYFAAAISAASIWGGKWQSTSWRPTRAARLWEVNFAQADSGRPIWAVILPVIMIESHDTTGKSCFLLWWKGQYVHDGHLGGDQTEFAILQRASRRPFRRWLFGFSVCTFSFY